MADRTEEIRARVDAQLRLSDEVFAIARELFGCHPADVRQNGSNWSILADHAARNRLELTALREELGRLREFVDAVERESTEGDDPHFILRRIDELIKNERLAALSPSPAQQEAKA